MRVIEFSPKFDWDSPTINAQEHSEVSKPSKDKKTKKPKKQSKKRLKGGR